MSKTLGLCLNLTNLACSQYAGWDFNSLGMLKGKPFGANEDGIFSLDDADDFDGTNISSFFKVHITDFGKENIKRLRAVFIGAEATGDMLLTVTDDEAHNNSYGIKVRDALQHGIKVPLFRHNQGRFFSFTITNVDGCDYSVDTIQALVIFLNRKPRPYDGNKQSDCVVICTSSNITL